MSSSQVNLVLILSTNIRDEKLSQPSPAPGLKMGPLMWQCKALTAVPPGFFLKIICIYIFIELQSNEKISSGANA